MKKKKTEPRLLLIIPTIAIIIAIIRPIIKYLPTVC